MMDAASEPPEWPAIRALLEAFLPKGAGPFTLLSWAVRAYPGQPPKLVKLHWRCELPGTGEHRVYRNTAHTYTYKYAQERVSFETRSVFLVEYPSYAEGEWVEPGEELDV